MQSIISLVFFVTYIVFQPPSTVIVRKLGPRIHLAVITILWGGCTIGMGFVKRWDQLAALRVILGVLEAGFFPSCVYLLSTWYTRCMRLPCTMADKADCPGSQLRSVYETRCSTCLAALPLRSRVYWPTVYVPPPTGLGLFQTNAP